MMLLKISCGSWVLDILASVASINLSQGSYILLLLVSCHFVAQCKSSLGWRRGPPAPLAYREVIQRCAELSDMRKQIPHKAYTCGQSQLSDYGYSPKKMPHALGIW